jgi:hypothetical protein
MIQFHITLHSFETHCLSVLSKIFFMFREFLCCYSYLRNRLILKSLRNFYSFVTWDNNIGFLTFCILDKTNLQKILNFDQRTYFCWFYYPSHLLCCSSQNSGIAKSRIANSRMGNSGIAISEIANSKISITAPILCSTT